MSGISETLIDIADQNEDGSLVQISDFDDNSKKLSIVEAGEAVSSKTGILQFGSDGSNLRARVTDNAGILKSNIDVANIKASISTTNSTSTPLGIGATFTGTFEEVLGAASITMIIFADQDSATDGLVIEWSSDGVNVDEDDKFTIFANRGKQFTFGPPSRYFRVKYTNGSIAQTAFRMQVILKPFRGKPSSHRLIDNLNDNDDAELVKAIIAAKDPNGDYINLSTNVQGKLNVISSSTAVPTELANLVVQNVIDGGSDDLGVDGSVTPVEFTYDADPTDDILLQEISFLASQLNIKFDGTSFLGVSSLTNGLLIEITSDGITTEVANFIYTEDIAAFGITFLDREATSFIKSTLSLGGNIVLRAGTSDNVKVTVRDDLSKTQFKYTKVRVSGFKTS